MLRKSHAKGKLVQREDDSALEAGQAAKASKGTRVPMKEKKRGMPPPQHFYETARDYEQLVVG